MHPSTTYVLTASCLLLCAGCANGGKEDRPQSAVKVSAQHHMFGLRSLRGFGTFPVNPSVVFTDRGKLNLFDDSSYTITRPSFTSSADRYAIDTNGAFSVFVTGSGQEPSVVFRGGYGLIAPSPEYFFTDRVSTNASPSIGLYYGTRVVSGQVELEGGWHLLSLHAIFNQSLPSPDSVARGASGGVAIGAGAPGTLRTVSGTGVQGASGLTFGGTIQNILDGGGVGDGTCNLTVSYQVGAQTPDARVMQAAATNNLVLALDDDETDGEAGMLFLVRKFDTPASPVDSAQVLGRFLVGGHTFFVNPNNSGSDAFIGTVTLGQGGSFRLEATGADGADFTYTGSYTLAADGAMTISIPGTSETWFGAIDRSYQTFAFVDSFVEVRANNIPELNLGIGVREKTN